MRAWWHSPATKPDTRKYMWRRFRLILQFERTGQFFTRQHLGPVGGVVDHRRNHCSRLHQVAGDGVIVNVHVGVMGETTVLHLILDELECGQTDGIERLMVGATGIANRYG